MFLQKEIKRNFKSQYYLILLRLAAKIFVPRNPCTGTELIQNIILHLRLCTITYKAIRFLISLDIILIRKWFVSCTINGCYFASQYKINGVFPVPQGVELSPLSEAWIPKLQYNVIFVILSRVWLRLDYYIHTTLNMSIEDRYKKYYQKRIISSAASTLLKASDIVKNMVLTQSFKILIKTMIINLNY